MNEQTADKQAPEMRRRAESQFREILDFDLKPEKIAAELRRRVIGQDEACQAMAVRLRQHVLQTRRMFAQRHVVEQPWRPDDLGGVLIIGPTGCGKTHLMRTMTQLSSLVFHMEDTTGLSETAYVGRDISDVARTVVQSASSFRPLAETALVFLDETDKLRFRPDAGGKDVTGEGVQRSLLALLDGNEVYFGTDDRRARHYVWRTDALLIVLGGAFAGLDQIVARRVGRKRARIGFGRDLSPADQAEHDADLMGEVVADDLIQYGFMPELVGRLRDIVVIRPLGADALRDVLLQPEHGPLASYQNMAAAEGFVFELTDELVDAIVNHAMASGQGARVLRRVMAQVTRRVLFEVPSIGQKRGTPIARLDVQALQDGSYELTYGSSARGPMPSPEGLVAELALQQWLSREPDAPRLRESTDAATRVEAEAKVPDALAADAQDLAASIGEQIRTEGYEVDTDCEVRMSGRELGAGPTHRYTTPVARVNLWVRHTDHTLPPPKLHGHRLRTCVRRAGIGNTNWQLLKGARSHDCRRRRDQHRWRRHVVYICLDPTALPQFLSDEDQGDRK